MYESGGELPPISIGSVLCDFPGFDLGFKKLKDIDCALIVETKFGVV